MATRRRAASTSLGPETMPGSVLTNVVNSTTRAASKSRRRALGSKRRGLRRWAIWYRDLSFRRTWLNPLLIVLVTLGFYARNPTPENPVEPFVKLSYPQPDPKDPSKTVYGKGLKDIQFVLFFTVVLTFTREFVMKEILRPFAFWCGLRKKNKIGRFLEQTYTTFYICFIGPFGLYVMYNSPMWYFNTRAFYEEYPHKTHNASFKLYYLFQAAFWAQQMIVLLLRLEKPRKDYKEFVMHHFVTLSLIALSYRFHFTYMGLAVYLTHDISDFFLATSKTFNYLDAPESFIGPYFLFFMGSWAYLRHYLNLHILWSVLTEFRTVGSWEINWETGTYKHEIAQVVCFGLLASLQALNLFWFYLILKIARRYMFPGPGEGLADVRSEDEDSGAEDEEKEEEVKVLEGKKDLKGVSGVLLNGTNGMTKPIPISEVSEESFVEMKKEL